MKTRTARLSLLAGVLIGALLLWAAIAPKLGGPQGKPPAPKAEKQAGPAQLMEKVRLEGAGSDGGRWVISAARAESDAAGEIGSLMDVRVEHSGKSGLTVGTAARAERRNIEGGFIFTGGVRITRGEWTATTESAVYEPDKGFLSSEGSVALEAENIRIEGRGLKADINGSWARILANSRAVIKGAKR